MRISVITPSIRKEGLDIVRKALFRQTFTDYEWIIGSPFISKYCDKYVRDDFEGGYFTLNRIYNKMIKESSGELIVSLQDYTHIKPDALEKFWYAYKDNQKAIVSGVGNKYKDNTWMVKTWQDPRIRKDQGSFYECYPWDVEANFCAVPRKAIYDVGGFDEVMDFEGYGFDARGVFERIDMLGKYKFYLDQANESFSLEHDRPKGWDEHNMLTQWSGWKKKNIDKKRYPVLKYIK